MAHDTYFIDHRSRNRWLPLLARAPDPMPQPFPRVIIGVICAFMILWLLQQFGIHTGLDLRLK
jgi:hypothetical protein